VRPVRVTEKPKLEYLAVYGRASIWALNTIKNLCSPKKWTDQSSPKFLGYATPKTSHHAKFHRDRSNQLGDRGEGVNWASDKNYFVMDRNVTRPTCVYEIQREARLKRKTKNPNSGKLGIRPDHPRRRIEMWSCMVGGLSVIVLSLV